MTNSPAAPATSAASGGNRRTRPNRHVRAGYQSCQRTDQPHRCGFACAAAARCGYQLVRALPEPLDTCLPGIEKIEAELGRIADEESGTSNEKCCNARPDPSHFKYHWIASAHCSNCHFSRSRSSRFTSAFQNAFAASRPASNSCRSRKF